MLRRAAALLCLLAVGGAGCGGGDSEADHARKAAETYVHDLGARDGDAVCADMTRALQKQFTETVSRGNPEVRGQACGQIMTLALRSIPYDQLKQFSTAKIESVEVKDSAGSFVYRLRDLKVDGKMTREGGAWKVSCCVPGQEG
jgi:hypothetical protein